MRVVQEESAAAEPRPGIRKWENDNDCCIQRLESKTETETVYQQCRFGFQHMLRSAKEDVRGVWFNVVESVR
jgi:hypothetical protein